MGRWPGLMGSIHTAFVSCVYAAASMTSARRPWFPPARVVRTLLAFCLRVLWCELMALKVGVPITLVSGGKLSIALEASLEAIFA